MREIAVAKKQLWDENGINRMLDYAILVNETEISPRMVCESYGVRIRGEGGETAEVPDLTVSSARIGELVELLVRNAVTPCTLRDVIDDWL